MKKFFWKKTILIWIMLTFTIKGQAFAIEPTIKEDKVVIAVLDTGVDYNHPYLKESLLKGKNFINDNKDEMDDCGHGTMVLGIIISEINNFKDKLHSNNNIEILPLKVLDESGHGKSSNVSKAIVYAVDYGVDIINLSFTEKEYSRQLYNAVLYAESKGVLITSAAGNGGSSVDFIYPSSFKGILTVGSIDENDNVANFSNVGEAIDVVAPGVNILSTAIEGKATSGNKEEGYYSVDSGTSYSVGYVSAAAALYKSKNKDTTSMKIFEEITKTATDLDTPGKDIKTGYGKLNTFKLLKLQDDKEEDTEVIDNTIQEIENNFEKVDDDSVKTENYIVEEHDKNNIYEEEKKKANEEVLVNQEESTNKGCGVGNTIEEDKNSSVKEEKKILPKTGKENSNFNCFIGVIMILLGGIGLSSNFKLTKGNRNLNI